MTDREDRRTAQRANMSLFGQRLTDWGESPPRRVIPQQCSICVNLRDDEVWTCDAFPEGIPGEILVNRFDHTRAYPGDQGIRFEPVKKKGKKAS